MSTTPNKQRRAAQRAKHTSRDYESLKHASQRTDLSVWTLRSSIATGQLPAFRTSDRPGSVIRVRVADVNALMKPVVPEEIYGDGRSRPFRAAAARDGGDPA